MDCITGGELAGPDTLQPENWRPQGKARYAGDPTLADNNADRISDDWISWSAVLRTPLLRLRAISLSTLIDGWNMVTDYTTMSVIDNLENGDRTLAEDQVPDPGGGSG
jgi:hypothetical protein